MYTRFIKPDLQDAIANTAVMLINGARQVGKSTLSEDIGKGFITSQFKAITLDNLSLLSAAHQSPLTFIEDLADNYPYICIDEIQRAPELFLPIKQKVDEKPGASHKLASNFSITER